MDSDLPYWLGFSVFPGIGPVRFSLLSSHFGSAELAWETSVSDLINVGLHPKLANDFDKFRHSFNPNNHLEELKKQNINVIPRYSSHYPQLLKEISDPPIVLYVKGKRGAEPINMAKTIAVVGTRRITEYGSIVTREISTDLANAGFTIVSGLAYGVDACAHQAALDARGATVAVLGCGVDVIAPRGNEKIYHDIINCGHGAVISEMPVSYLPSKGLFPARNRIISGLSQGVIVTQGADDSGALITSRYAADQGREVFAVPGSVKQEMSQASFKLIKSGAHLIESAQDVLQILGITAKVSQKSNYEPQNEVERIIIKSLTDIDGALDIDGIIKKTGLSAKEVSVCLTMLEMGRVIKNTGNNHYFLN